MIIALQTQFHIERPWGHRPFSICLNSVLNLKAVVAAFNQEKALAGAFSVITNLRMDLFEALVEDTLETLAEHYIEELVDLAEGGTEDDEDSPWWEWILQDVLKAGLEHYVIERLVHFRQPKTSE